MGTESKRETVLKKNKNGGEVKTGQWLLFSCCKLLQLRTIWSCFKQGSLS